MRRRDVLRSTIGVAAAAKLARWGRWSLHAQGAAAAPPPMRRYRLAFGRDRVTDLHRRIDATFWPRVPFNTGWSAGTDDQFLHEMVAYWRHTYEWPSVQADLNR